MSALANLALMLAIFVAPAGAQAHGPVAPVASSYLAKPSAVPAGLRAKVIDGDQLMWLAVAPNKTVVVLDPRGAPYLRFSRTGVEVNHNSMLYLLNQTPAQTPPTTLGRSTPPRWQHASDAHAYTWHEGRLHALASVAHLTGAAYLGRWSIPLQIDGRATGIGGSVFYAQSPSVVWFWPIAVVVLCLLAALRLDQRSLDLRLARALSLVALLAIVLAGAARALHGRPSVSALGLAGFAITLVFAGWALHQVTTREPGYFSCFAIAFVAAWEGAALIPTLLDGFTLLALPAWLARTATVVCLATATALLLLSFRLGRPKQGIAATSRQSDNKALAKESFA
ncbi:MAG: hypothetical protein JOZ73_10840 [Solirubrobacterales bacterium]|nr:hypothetical protein [Solirubrobacterales bacterium]